MKHLLVFYDNHCAFCRRCKLWAERQAQYLPLHFLPVHDPAVREAYPDLGHYAPEEEIVVFGSNGAVWRGDAAWLVILWALKDWRPFSLRAAGPNWRPTVRRLWQWVSARRK